MTEFTNYLLIKYAWNQDEVHALVTVGYEGIEKKFRQLTEKQFNAICKYFDGWLLGENKKDRLNYWLNQTGLTVAEVNIWMTV